MLPPCLVLVAIPVQPDRSWLILEGWSGTVNTAVLPGTGHWLIIWGNNGPTIAVSEVDPAGNEIFRMSMSKDGEQYGTAAYTANRRAPWESR